MYVLFLCNAEGCCWEREQMRFYRKKGKKEGKKRDVAAQRKLK
jgi:hypothetical protein